MLFISFVAQDVTQSMLVKLNEKCTIGRTWQLPLDNCPLKMRSMKLPLGLSGPGKLPPNNPPLHNYHPNNCVPSSSSPLWITIEKCFESSRFESELHLSEACIATGDPTRGGIVNPLLELWPFSTLFRSCFVTESRKLN